MDAAHQNIKVQLAVTVVGVSLFIIKLLAWYFTNSVAILTDAIESIINILTGLIGLYSLYVSARPRDTNHPYGHGKVEFVSSGIEGTLILVSGLAIIYAAITNLVHPHTILQLNTGIILISISAFINYLVGSYAIRNGRKNNSLPLISGGKHLVADAWSTGSLVVGLIVLSVTRLVWIDSIVALIFALIIIRTGYKIIRQSLAGIMDEADIELLGKLVDLLNENRRKSWVDLHNLRIIKYGSILHLDCHLTVPWYFNVNEAHHEIDGLEHLVKTNYGESLEIFVHTDGCLDFSCKLCTLDNCPVRKHECVHRIDWTIENISANSKHQLASS